jgi:hypothetical protein
VLVVKPRLVSNVVLNEALEAFKLDAKAFAVLAKPLAVA